jgi:hypothetical protein
LRGEDEGGGEKRQFLVYGFLFLAEEKIRKIQ